MFRRAQISEAEIKAKKYISPYYFPGLPAKEKPKAKPVAIAKPIKKIVQRFLLTWEFTHPILEYITFRFGLDTQEIMTKTREKNYILARQVYYYVLRKYTEATLMDIAKSLYYHPKHYMVMYAIEQCDNAISIQDDFGKKIIDICNNLEELKLVTPKT